MTIPLCKLNYKTIAMDYQTRTMIGIAGASMWDGETIRTMDCPLCFGGASKERAFSITRKGNTILYKCFRASCGVAGLVEVYGTLGEPLPAQSELPYDKMPTKMERTFQEKLSILPPEAFSMFMSKFGIKSEEIHNAAMRYAPDSDRYVFPVRSNICKVRGYMVRTFREGTQFPKWDAFPHPGVLDTDAWLSWHFSFATLGSKGPIVVVEDQISAIKTARHFRSVALLGTTLNLDRILEISEFAGRSKSPVILALDKDATAKAIDYLREWAFFTGNKFSSIPLAVDFKYEEDKNILELVNSAVGK